MYTAIMLKCCLLSYRKCKQKQRERGKTLEQQGKKVDSS